MSGTQIFHLSSNARQSRAPWTIWRISTPPVLDEEDQVVAIETPAHVQVFEPFIMAWPRIRVWRGEMAPRPLDPRPSETYIAPTPHRIGTGRAVAQRVQSIDRQG